MKWSFWQTKDLLLTLERSLGRSLKKGFERERVKKVYRKFSKTNTLFKKKKSIFLKDIQMGSKCSDEHWWLWSNYENSKII